MFVESTIKADSLGINMTRKVKRIGCSGIKDLLEEKKLDIVDEDTILEISTFISKGQSYEASDGNHDDLMMNLVLFGYFIGTVYFGELTDIDIKQMMFEQRMEEIERDTVPFGFYDNGLDTVEEKKEDPWLIQQEEDYFLNF